MACCASSTPCEDSLLGCLSLLLSHGVRIDAYERHRMTAIMFAAKEGRTKVVRKLITEGASIDRQDNQGWSALCWAASKGHGLVVRLLLEANADPCQANRHGQRPSDVALSAGHSQLCEVLERACTRPIDQAFDTDGVSSDHGIAPLGAPKVTAIKSNIKDDAPGGEVSELEAVLTALDLDGLIPILQKEGTSLEALLRLSDSDLQRIGVGEAHQRRTLLQAIATIHKQEWKTTSLVDLAEVEFLAIPDAAAMLLNISKHLRFINASVGYLRDRIEASPRILELGQEKHNVSTLAESCSDSLRKLFTLTQEITFFKAYLDKVSGNVEYRAVDTIVLPRSADGGWQRRRVLCFGATAVCVTTALWWFKSEALTTIWTRLLAVPKGKLTLLLNFP